MATLEAPSGHLERNQNKETHTEQVQRERALMSNAHIRRN